ncbi:MAG: family 78 glycoside hydrolase catalytic domain [Planctomycetaceae bacterium]|jgi:alpha-L-rhamnosidase|nr:family 78 glycoside hydrolase catalytic domain [Planctomycetaceae bacterium]
MLKKFTFAFLGLISIVYASQLILCTNQSVVAEDKNSPKLIVNDPVKDNPGQIPVKIHLDKKTLIPDPRIYRPHGDIMPYDFRTEYLIFAKGIDVTRPRFSWKLKQVKKPLEKNQFQSAYQIEVFELAPKENRQLEKKNKIWTSGKVQSNSTMVEFDGRGLLKSNTYYCWELLVWDRTDKPSMGIGIYFSTGYLYPESTNGNNSQVAGSDSGRFGVQEAVKGQWIGVDSFELVGGEEGELVNLIRKNSWIWANKDFRIAPVGKAMFRKSFQLPESYKKTGLTGQLTLTADNSFTVYLNDKKVGTGDDFKKWFHFNITDFLKEGKNVIAVEVVNGDSSPNPAGLIGVAKIQNGGDGFEVAIDDSWKSILNPPAKSETSDFDDSLWSSSVKVAGLDNNLWKRPGTDETASPPARYLTKNFNTGEEFKDKKIVLATAKIAGLGYYELYINKKKIGDHELDPVLTDYNKRVPYVTYKIDPSAINRNDVNKINVILGNGRYYAPRQNSPARTISYGYPKLIFELTLHYNNGQKETIASDQTWNISTNGRIRDNNDYDGEIFDARKTDFTTEHKALLVEKPKGKLVAQMMPAMKIVERIEALSVKDVGGGTWIFDFGVNLVGNCELRIPAGLPAGTKLQLRHAESLTKDGKLYTANLRGAKSRDIYIASGNESTAEVEPEKTNRKNNSKEINDNTTTTPTYYSPTFTYHGFRYAELTGLPDGVKVDKGMLSARVINTDLPKSGKFETSNTMINSIYKNAVRGIQGNYLSIPTDCPQRDERQGWQGDRAAESKGEMYIFNNVSLYSKWLIDVEDSQRPDGNLSDVCPNYWQFYSSNVTWPSSFLIVPDNIYTMYGDKRPIERHYAAMKRWLIGHLGQFVKDGLIAKDNYGDWCVPPERPELIHSKDPARQTSKTILATSYYIHCLDLLTKYAKILGKQNEANEFTEKAKLMKNAINTKFLNKETGKYDNGSQTSSVLPLRFGIVPDEYRTKVFGSLVGNIENVTKNHVGTGLIGGQWLNRVLTDFGRGDIAYKFTTNEDYPSWGYMVKNDATTIWELWNGNTANPAMNSGNHVMLLGDLIIWYYEYLAGIKPDPERVGFEHLIMKPHVLGDLKFVNAEYESIRGLVVSRWKLDGKSFNWEIDLPPGTTADVHLPDGRILDNIPSGKHTFNAEIK